MNRIFLLFLLFIANTVFADAREVDAFHWEGVERVVAIGDLHGDYENYIAVLTAAGLVDRKGKWAGGKTHLVQTGDIPDRGPDTLKIIGHIQKLAKQAERKGGKVHSLIGNHEAMNMYGDLRYVSPGEYKAFVTRGSESMRDRYFTAYMSNFEARDPEGFAALPENFRKEWNNKYPLGWIEHRQAWDPAWNPEAEIGKWVLEQKIAIQINGSIFLHGGISSFYCQNSLEWVTRTARDNLAHFDPGTPGIIEDEFGPLWYRGLSGVEPQALPETVDAILKFHGARHIIVGHTPTSGVIWPRYDAKVIMIDSGIASAYGGHIAYLEITPDGLFAGYPKDKFPLPANDGGQIAYLEKVIGQNPDNPLLKKRLEDLQQPPPPIVASASEGQAPQADPEAGGADAVVDEEPVAPAIPICGTAQ